MKIKDLPNSENLGGKIFIHPQTKEKCVWVSQWNYPDGAAGIWYRNYGGKTTQIHPLFLKKLEEALEFEIYKE